MNEKLEPGNAFPAMSLTAVDGTQVPIPAAAEAGHYQIVLFFRGKF